MMRVEPSNTRIHSRIHEHEPTTLGNGSIAAFSLYGDRLDEISAVRSDARDISISQMKHQAGG